MCDMNTEQVRGGGGGGGGGRRCRRAGGEQELGALGQGHETG